MKNKILPLLTLALTILLIILCLYKISNLTDLHSLESYLYKFCLVSLCILAWFKTQRLIHLKGFPKKEIGDLSHDLLKNQHKYLFNNKNASNKLLIISSLIIDIFGLGLIAIGICGESLAPFLALMILFGMRQISQAFCSLPAPKGMIWHYPGVPSLFVTYGTTNDFFFSGHTAIAVLGAIVACAHSPWIIALLALLGAIFEIWTVLVLRAHYTMDIIGAILGAGCAYIISLSICKMMGI
jgi:hypothetical protein